MPQHTPAALMPLRRTLKGCQWGGGPLAGPQAWTAPGGKRWQQQRLAMQRPGLPQHEALPGRGPSHAWRTGMNTGDAHALYLWPKVIGRGAGRNQNGECQSARRSRPCAVHDSSAALALPSCGPLHGSGTGTYDEHCSPCSTSSPTPTHQPPDRAGKAAAPAAAALLPRDCCEWGSSSRAAQGITHACVKVRGKCSSF